MFEKVVQKVANGMRKSDQEASYMAGVLGYDQYEWEAKVIVGGLVGSIVVFVGLAAEGAFHTAGVISDFITLGGFAILLYFFAVEPARMMRRWRRAKETQEAR